MLTPFSYTPKPTLIRSSCYRPFSKATNSKVRHNSYPMILASYLRRAETFITLAGEIFPECIQRSPFRQFTQHVKPTRTHAARLINSCASAVLAVATGWRALSCRVVYSSSSMGTRILSCCQAHPQPDHLVDSNPDRCVSAIF